MVKLLSFMEELSFQTCSLQHKWHTKLIQKSLVRQRETKQKRDGIFLSFGRVFSSSSSSSFWLSGFGCSINNTYESLSEGLYTTPGLDTHSQSVDLIEPLPTDFGIFHCKPASFFSPLLA